MSNGEYDWNMYCSINADMVDFTEVDLCQNDELDQESKVIKSEQYSNLSQESKTVISIIVNTPSEIIDMITTPTGEKSKNLIIKYLLKRWRSKLIVESVVQEITEFVRSL